jgi:dihydrofolate reductase
MSNLKVQSFTISLDGYGAGPDQSLQNPLGVGGEELHEWLVTTRTFHQMQKRERAFHEMQKGEDGSTDVDDSFARRGFANIGAWILGRNMFGPVRGPWPDESWKGWWGDEPPYHVPVFVLTHHARPPVTMQGGTTFHFVTDGIESALRQAREAAAGRDVRVGGGAATIRQYLRAKLIDEMHVAIAPVVLGSGEPLLAGIHLPALGYRVSEHVTTPKATHVVFTRD